MNVNEDSNQKQILDTKTKDKKVNSIKNKFKCMTKKKKIIISIISIILLLLICILPNNNSSSNNSGSSSNNSSSDNNRYSKVNEVINEKIKSSELYGYTNSYILSGFENSVIIFEGKDTFEKLDDKTKYAYVKKVYDGVRSAILKYGTIKQDDRDNLLKLIQQQQVKITIGDKEYLYKIDELTKPDGKIVKIEEKKNEADDKKTQEALDNEIANFPLSEDDKSELKYNIKEIVKNNLKAPSTAKFCSSSEMNITKDSNSQYCVVGWVDADNSYGAKLRNTFIVKFKRTSSGWVTTGCSIS